MNLIGAIVWLTFGLGLFLYEYQVGYVPLMIQGLNISFGWIGLVLGVYNLARWYAKRSIVEDNSARMIREARVRQSQRRERQEPDPTFDFSDRPAPPNGIRPPIDQPPSNN